MKKNILITGLVGIVFAAIGAYFGLRHLEPVAPQATAVDTLLAQTMSDTTGTPQSLAQWKGKALVVNFWATWCAPCVEEMPELSELQTEIAPADIQIIGIGIDSAANIAQFASKYKIGYPLYTAGISATDISRQLGNQASALPFTVLIGRDGQVRKTYLGRLKMQELREDLARL